MSRGRRRTDVVEPNGRSVARALMDRRLSVVQLDATADPERCAAPHVPESRFGVWFLGTDTWTEHVLEEAVNDLERLIKRREPSYPVIVDVGCGWGQSFKLLND